MVSIIPDVPWSCDKPQADTADVGGTVHQPDGTLACRSILPNNIGFAVSVKITRSHHIPSCGNRPQAPGADKRGAIHEPDGTLAVGIVLPQNVCFAIAVEVATTR